MAQHFHTSTGISWS